MNSPEEMIEELVEALGPEASYRDKHMFREALRALVRLTQAELLTSLQKDFHTVEVAISNN